MPAEAANVFMLPQAYARETLADILPLPNPLSLQVDPASLCNFKCAFCPTGDPKLIKQSGRSQTFMGLDLYKKIIADISRFERNLKVLRLYKDGEPLLNPHFLDMVRLAKAEPRIERVETTSNGSKLEPVFNEQLVAAGLDRIVLSIEGVTAERYRSFARVRLDFDAFVENVRHLHSIRGDLRIHVKTVAQNLDYAAGEDKKFFDTFGPISDGIYIENTVASWPQFDVDGAAPEETDLYGRQTVRKTICPYLFYTLSINSDGSVSPCCVDWNRELVLGSVADEGLLDIWNGAAMQTLRRQHIVEGLAANPSCGSCGQVHTCTNDNLDGEREKLKKLFV